MYDSTLAFYPYVWAFHRLKKPRCREMSARGYALHSVCPQLSFFLPLRLDSLEENAPQQSHCFMIMFFQNRFWGMICHVLYRRLNTHHGLPITQVSATSNPSRIPKLNILVSHHGDGGDPLVTCRLSFWYRWMRVRIKLPKTCLLGRISMVTFYVTDSSHMYLLDIFTMPGPDAFSDEPWMSLEWTIRFI